MQGRPQHSPKIISIPGAKNEPKTDPLYLLVLVMTIFPFLLLMKEVPYFQSLQIEALRGSARSGRGHASEATPRTQNSLAQVQSFFPRVWPISVLNLNIKINREKSVQGKVASQETRTRWRRVDALPQARSAYLLTQNQSKTAEKRGRGPNTNKTHQ